MHNHNKIEIKKKQQPKEKKEQEIQQTLQTHYCHTNATEPTLSVKQAVDAWGPTVRTHIIISI